MGQRQRILIVGCCLMAAGCGRWCASPLEQAPRVASDARVRGLADAYLDGYFSRYPDQVTLFGVPGRRHDTLPDNSIEALRAWQAREDAWLKEAQQAMGARFDIKAFHDRVLEDGAVPSRCCATRFAGGQG